MRFKNGSSQVEYHASVMEKDDVHKRPPTKKYPLDIMMLMFDGTSSAHFQRMLRKTFQLLSADLKGHVFKAYSIVGENTNPAMTALLTGRTVQENIEEYGDTRRHSSDAKTVDDWPFIFKDFKRRGFATMLSEDQPYLGECPKQLSRVQSCTVLMFSEDQPYVGECPKQLSRVQSCTVLMFSEDQPYVGECPKQLSRVQSCTVLMFSEDQPYVGE